MKSKIGFPKGNQSFFIEKKEKRYGNPLKNPAEYGIIYLR